MEEQNRQKLEVAVTQGNKILKEISSNNNFKVEVRKPFNNLSIDFLSIWSPLYDAKDDQGGLLIYENSHKHGYFKHHIKNKFR